jgi:hypothetical protein
MDSHPASISTLVRKIISVALGQGEQKEPKDCHFMFKRHTRLNWWVVCHTNNEFYNTKVKSKES